MTEAEAIEAMARASENHALGVPSWRDALTDNEWEAFKEIGSEYAARHFALARSLFAAIRPYLDAQFAAGAEAMRDAAAKACENRENVWRMHIGSTAPRREDRYCADAIRALPIPDRPTDTEPKPDARVARRP